VQHADIRPEIFLQFFGDGGFAAAGAPAMPMTIVFIVYLSPVFSSFYHISAGFATAGRNFLCRTAKNSRLTAGEYGTIAVATKIKTEKENVYVYPP
jgi:hypothetical protein